MSRGGPEPATYRPSDMNSLNGDYIISKFKTLGTKKFIAPTSARGASDERSMQIRTETPGPGSYVLPSDFGVTLPARGGTEGGMRHRNGGRRQTVSQMQ